MSYTILNVSYSVFALAAAHSQVYFYVKQWPNADDGYVLSCICDNSVVFKTEVIKPNYINHFIENFYQTSVPVFLEDDTIAMAILNSFLTQERFDILNDVIYIGKAVRGITESQTGWTITKINLTNGNPTSKQQTSLGKGVWENRENEFYY